MNSGAVRVSHGSGIRDARSGLSDICVRGDLLSIFGSFRRVHLEVGCLSGSSVVFVVVVVAVVVVVVIVVAIVVGGCSGSTSVEVIVIVVVVVVVMVVVDFRGGDTLKLYKFWKGMSGDSSSGRINDSVSGGG